MHLHTVATATVFRIDSTDRLDLDWNLDPVDDAQRARSAALESLSGALVRGESEICSAVPREIPGS